MAFRVYVVPVVGVGTKADARRPKYFADGSVTGDWVGMDYGLEPWMAVGASLSGADDVFVVAQPDTLALPFNLEGHLTAQNVTTVSAKLEAVNLPAHWLTPAWTWRAMAREVLAMCNLLQRFTAVHGAGRFFSGGVTLDTTIGALSVAVRNDLIATVTSLGLSTAGITGPTPIRTAWTLVADQMQGWPFYLGEAI